MIRQSWLVLAGSVLFLALRTAAGAQDFLEDEIPLGLRDRAIIMEIATRIVEQDEEVVWDSENTRVTISGRPVGLQLVGTNIIIVVQFTPYIRPRGGNFLVAQGQIWIHIPNEGMSFHTCMETIPMEFNELIYFFPLGSTESENDSQIEMQIVLHPYIMETSEDPRSRRTRQ